MSLAKSNKLSCKLLLGQTDTQTLEAQAIYGGTMYVEHLEYLPDMNTQHRYILYFITSSKPTLQDGIVHEKTVRSNMKMRFGIVLA